MTVEQETQIIKQLNFVEQIIENIENLQKVI